MPTQGGKPKTGDVLIHEATGNQVKVLLRYPGTVAYSCKVVQLNGPRPGTESIMTEVDYWLQHGWSIEAPANTVTVTLPTGEHGPIDVASGLVRVGLGRALVNGTPARDVETVIEADGSRFRVTLDGDGNFQFKAVK